MQEYREVPKMSANMVERLIAIQKVKQQLSKQPNLMNSAIQTLLLELEVTYRVAFLLQLLLELQTLDAPEQAEVVTTRYPLTCGEEDSHTTDLAIVLRSHSLNRLEAGTALLVPVCFRHMTTYWGSRWQGSITLPSGDESMWNLERYVVDNLLRMPLEKHPANMALLDRWLVRHRAAEEAWRRGRVAHLRYEDCLR